MPDDGVARTVAALRRSRSARRARTLGRPRVGDRRLGAGGVEGAARREHPLAGRLGTDADDDGATADRGRRGDRRDPGRADQHRPGGPAAHRRLLRRLLRRRACRGRDRSSSSPPCSPPPSVAVCGRASPPCLKVWRNVPEVLTTLLLTFIAFPLLTFGLRNTWLLGDRANRTRHINSGEQIPFDTRLPNLDVFGNRIDSAVVLALGAAVIVAYVVGRTRLGARIDVLGLNPRAAQRFGVPRRPLTAAVLVASGCFAGARRRRAADRRGIRRPVVRRVFRELRVGWTARRPRRPQPCPRGDPHGVRLRRPAHRVELPRRHRRRPPDDRRRPGVARARPADPAGDRCTPERSAPALAPSIAAYAGHARRSRPARRSRRRSTS